MTTSTHPNKTIKMAIYYERVSTTHESQDNSMENQRKLCETYLKRHPEIQLAEPIDTYVEKVSGKSDVRPCYQAMLERLKEGDIDYVLIKDFKRLNRSTEVSAKIKTLSRKYGFKFILLSTGQIYDPNQSENRMLYGFESLVNEEVVYRQSEYGRIAHRQKCDSKTLNRNNVTFGYRWNPVTSEIEIDEEQAEIVKEVFDMYVFQNKGMLEIRKYLQQEYGLCRTANTIRNWLSETAYIGIFHLNKKGSELGVGSGQKTKRFTNPREEWVPVERPELAIVDKEVFDLVQKIKESKQKTYNADKNGVLQGRFLGTHLFSGLIFCKECNCSYIHSYADRKQKISIYKDSNRIRVRNLLEECRNTEYKRIYEEDMKRIVVRVINTMLTEKKDCFERVFAVLEDVISEGRNEKNKQKVMRKELDKTYATLEKTKLAYIDANHGPLRNALEQDYENLLKRIETLEKELEESDEKVQDTVDVKSQIEAVKRALGDLKEVNIDTLNREEVRSLFQRMEIDAAGHLDVFMRNNYVSGDGTYFLIDEFEEPELGGKRARKNGKERSFKVSVKLNVA